MVGIENDYSVNVVEKLNVLLANYQIHYQNLRGLHWNIKGKNFFELHVKFEEYYADAQMKIDTIAERILTLGAVPLHTFNDYVALSKISIGKNINKDVTSVKLVVSGLEVLLVLEREILQISSEASDEGTNAMMSDFIAEQEKTVWMLHSWLA